MAGILVVCAFLIGSIPTGVLLTKVLTGQDVRRLGSGNIGAANVARTAGIKIGALVATVDMLKGAVPVLVARALGLDEIALAGVAAAAVVGHDFSIFLRFRGGKGVATTLGALLALAPLPTLMGMAIWVGVMAAWRYRSLASLIALAALPCLVAITGNPYPWIILAVCLFLLAAAKHYENIVRLARGQERKFRRSGPAQA